RPLPVVAAGMLLAFLGLPIVGLIAATGWSDLLAGIRHPLALAALRLSLFTTSVSLAFVLVLGTPLAWLLARRSGWLVRATETIVKLPIVIPPAVAGV